MSEWKSFKINTPQIGTHILVADISTRDICIAIADPSDGDTIEIDLPIGLAPTHWMYIPELTDE